MSLLHRYRAQQRTRHGQPGPRREPIKQPDLQSAAERLGITPKHIGHYAQALSHWAAAGFPTRTQGEVEACLAICRECEHFAKGRCKKCGCCVNRSKVAVVNKAKMASEDCPEGKWPPAD